MERGRYGIWAIHQLHADAFRAPDGRAPFTPDQRNRIPAAFPPF